MPRSVLVVTDDRLGETLGGAAIRAYEIARSLRDVADVTLAGPGTEPPGLAPARHVPFEPGDPRALRGLFREADVVIMRPPNPVVASWLRASNARSSTTSAIRSRSTSWRPRHRPHVSGSCSGTPWPWTTS